MQLHLQQPGGSGDTISILQAPLPRGVTTLLLAALLVAAALLYRGRFVQHDLLADDFQFVTPAQSWSGTWESLATPHSVHFCPLFRLLTGAVVSLASRPSELRLVLVPPTLAVFFLMLVAVYAFLERETETPLAGLLGVIVMGFSSNLGDTVAWYSSSQAQWSFLFLVLTLLAAQRYRMAGGVLALGAVAVLSLLAPCWWTMGVVAGPTAGLYLYATVAGTRMRRMMIAVVPLIATIAYLTLVVLLELWGSAVQRFQLVPTLYQVLRGTVETLVLRNGGIALDPWSLEKWLVYSIIVSAVAIWWFLRGSRRQLLWLGIGLWLMSYGIVYGYSEAYGADRGGRYQIASQFALILFICGGLKTPASSGGRLTLRDALVVVALGTLFWLTHHRAIAQKLELQRSPFQAMQLGQLELIADAARREGIGLDVLREAIGPFKIQGAHPGFDGLTLVEKSIPPTTDPDRSLSVAEVRQRIKVLLE